MHTHLYSCLRSVIVSQSAETPSVTPSPLPHTHTHTRMHAHLGRPPPSGSMKSASKLKRIPPWFWEFWSWVRWAPHPVWAWKKKGALLKILLFPSPADRMVTLTSNLFSVSSQVVGVSHRVRSQLTWPKVEICAWQDSLLSHDLRAHHGHVLKPSLLPVLPSSTLILHPSFPGTLMLKCF